jgi:DUF4097 and DUF4098 domain-containing protein YvlB
MEAFMNRHHQLPARIGAITGAILGTACALFVFTLGAHAADHRGDVTEEFHQTYNITPDGRVELNNINGDVHISSWDQNQVKVDAVKYADDKEDLDEAKIEVDSGKDYVSIRTRYPEHGYSGHHHSASVEYTLTVPRTVRLDEIKLVNGALDITGVSGEVRASCVNGRLDAHNLAGRAELSTVNGSLDARFEQLAGASVDLNSVNGGVDLTIPSDSKAEIEASTVSGGIRNDFGLHEKRHQFVGHELRGELAGGGTRIKLANVNGRIEIHRADDGRALSPVKDLNGDDSEL